MVKCLVCYETRAFYNYSDLFPEYCSNCKDQGMIDVVHKKCKHEGCNSQPYFNLPGETKGLFCSKHKDEGMIDVVNKKCKHDECNQRPLFNLPGQTKGLFCSKHKEEGMVNVLEKRKCEHEGCNSQPHFNLPGETKGLFCGKHKEQGMVDIFEKRICKHDWCNTQTRNEEYQGYCFFCFRNLYPDHKLSRNYKTKELEVSRYVRETFSEYDWRSDKTVDGGCSRKRPDLLCDFGKQVVIVEVDENQHTDYDCSCENKRLMEISQDLDHRPIVFIRFNPDGYNLNGKKVSSCWKMNNGKMSISKKKEWNNRLETLKEQIEYWSMNDTNKTIEIIQLFYDE